MNAEVKALYLHIPFCEKICAYCDFPKVLCHSVSHEDYFSSLMKEIEETKIPEDSLKTIYIGGGTPSSVETYLLKMLLSYLHTHFPSVEEFTMEANPESLTDEKIELCQKYGVNRISLGVQSADNRLLKTLNRNHSVEDAKACVKRLKKHRFQNFNLDFIYGIPTMTDQDLDDDISLAISLNPTHLSFYSLQIEEGTLFKVRHVLAESDDTMARQYQHILNRLEEKGYYRYEVSNFSKPGYESKHNLTYWHDEFYYACGLGAASYAHDVRRCQTRSITDYIRCLKNFSEEKIGQDAEEFEFLMLNLRLVEGFSLERFYSRFNKKFEESYKNSIETVKDKVEIVDGFFRIKKEYLYVMDSILLELLPELAD